MPDVQHGELFLVSPSRDLEDAFREMATEFASEGRDRLLRALDDFEGYVGRLSNSAAGGDLSPGRVPESHFWLVCSDVIAGTSRLRHTLTPDLEIEGGHIGYDIRPSYRRRGFGTALLRLTLVRAAELGLSRARLTCDADNFGSIRVIENNGGMLDGEALSLSSGKPIRQYWVPTAFSDRGRGKGV